jgi:hypothetical protein
MASANVIFGSVMAYRPPIDATLSEGITITLSLFTW